MSLSRKDRPLYLQIKNIIKDRILYGEYALGSNIPSEPQLENEFGVSKITVRNAIQELVQEGYLEKGSGKGTKVIRITSTSKLSRWKRFTEILVEEGHRIQKQWLRADMITCDVDTEPYRLFGDQALKLERVYFLDDVPYIYYTHYLVKTIGNLDLADLNAQSLYELLEEQNISLDKLRDEFDVSASTEDIAAILRIATGKPLLKRSRYSYDDQGNVKEYSIGYYNTELQNYVVNYDV